MKIFIDLNKLQMLHTKLESAHRKTALILEKFKNAGNVADFGTDCFDEALNIKLFAIKSDLEFELLCIEKHLKFLDYTGLCYGMVENDIGGENQHGTVHNGALAGIIKGFVLKTGIKPFQDLNIPDIFDGLFGDVTVADILSDAYFIEPWLKEIAGKMKNQGS